jgi:hypothetical protein
MSKPSKSSPYVCEVCGELATCFTCDTIELPPCSKDGLRRQRQVALYENHAYCHVHHKKPVQYDAAGHKIAGRLLYVPDEEFERKHWGAHG